MVAQPTTQYNRDKVMALRVVAPPIPPTEQVANHVAEIAVIGSVLQKPELYPALAPMLQPADFHDPLRAFVWFAFESILKTAGAQIDLVTVQTELRRHSQLIPHQGDFETWTMLKLTELKSGAPNIDNVEEYARAVAAASTRLRLMKAATEVVQLASNGALAVDDLKAEAERIIFRAVDRQEALRSHVSAAVADYRADFEAMLGVQEAIPTGFQALDTMFGGGFYPGELVVGGGGEGMGKTSWVMSIIRNALLEDKVVIHAPGEMPRHDIVRRLSIMGTGLGDDALRQRKVTPEQLEELRAAWAQIGQFQYHIVDDTVRFRVVHLRRKCRQVLIEHGRIDLLVADGIWLMESEHPELPRHQQVHEITLGLKELANEFNCPVFALQQYTYEYHKQKSAPRLDFLAESAAVRRNADVILALHRPSFLDRNAEDDNGTEVHVLKSRNKAGIVGQYIGMSYHMDRLTYVGLTERDQSLYAARNVRF